MLECTKLLVFCILYTWIHTKVQHPQHIGKLLDKLTCLGSDATATNTRSDLANKSACTGVTTRMNIARNCAMVQHTHMPDQLGG